MPPKNRVPADAKDPLELKEKGNKEFAKGNFEEAAEFFTQALSLHGADAVGSAALLSNRSVAYAKMRNFERALADADAAAALRPEWAKAQLRRGAALEGLYRYTEALAAYLQGLKLDANDAALKQGASDMQALVNELKLSERELKEGNPEADKFDTLVSWLHSGGAKFPKLYMRYYSDDYRGVHALTRIDKGEILLEVPLPLIMTSEIAKASDIGKKIISSGVELRSKHSYLAAYLLQERSNPDSFWQPYLGILPVKYANMPVFFDEPTLLWLKGSMTLQKIADRIDSLRREYDNIKRAVPEFGRFTLDEFIWARFVVITRIFGLTIDGNKTDGLVPYADMLNHKKTREAGGVGKDECETKWTYDDARRGFTITAVKTLPRGDQVYDSYGRKCNSRFFVNYGFTLDENKEDNEAVMRLMLPSSDPLYHVKLRYLGNEGSARREFQVPCNYRERKCKSIYSFLRFVHAQDGEFLMLQTGESKDFKIDEIEPISVRNERLVLRDLKKAAQAALALFPDSLEHDNKLLSSEELKDFNLRNCVVMRRGEKEVLHTFIEIADKASPLLSLPWKDLKKIAAKSANSTSPLDYYIAAVVVPLVKKG